MTETLVVAVVILWCLVIAVDALLEGRASDGFALCDQKVESAAPLPPQPGASTDSWQQLVLEVDANTALRGQLGVEVTAPSPSPSPSLLQTIGYMF